MGQFTSRQQKEVLTGLKERTEGAEPSFSELLEGASNVSTDKAIQLTTKAGLNRWLVEQIISEEVHTREKLAAAGRLADLNGLSGAKDADLRRMSDQELHDFIPMILQILEPCGVRVDLESFEKRKRGRPPKSARTERRPGEPRTETTTGRARESLHPQNPSPPVPAQPLSESTEGNP